jgi:hypothetical protein
MRTKAQLRRWIKHGGGVAASFDKLVPFVEAQKALEDAMIAAALNGNKAADIRALRPLRNARDAAFLGLD